MNLHWTGTRDGRIRAATMDAPEGHIVYESYNDWLVDFCRPHPDRPIGLACLPYGDIDAAVAECQALLVAGKLDAVYLCYTKFINTMKQEPMVEQLLPLSGERLGAPEDQLVPDIFL